MSEELRKKILISTVNDILELYYKKLDEFVVVSEGNLLETDVLLMIMNIMSSLNKMMYKSIKEALPDAKFDYDVIKTNLINDISDEFDRLKSYSPNKINLETIN